MHMRSITTYLLTLVGVHLFCASILCAQEISSHEEDDSRWALALRLGGVYEVQPDDDLTVLQSGFGYDLELIVPISRRFAITATFGRSGLRADDLPIWSVAFETQSSTIEYRNYRYLVGVRYSTSKLFGVSWLDYYFELSGGGSSRDITGELLLRDKETDQLYVGKFEPADRKFEMELGIGVMGRAGKNLAIDLGFTRFIGIESRETDPESTEYCMWQSLGIRLGVTIGFISD